MLKKNRHNQGKDYNDLLQYLVINFVFVEIFLNDIDIYNH